MELNKRIFQCSLFIFYLLISSCKTYRPDHSFIADHKTLIPDYSNLEAWAAHPLRNDLSDKTPDKLPLKNENFQVDVFFVHPTIYYGDKHEDQWNGPIDDDKLNKKIDESTILFQASAFNQAGNIYAPRYRQAHIHAYFSKDKSSAKKAFDLAYSDVKKAFQYYLENYNNNNPFIIASHSQGTDHAQHLIDDFIDNKVLSNKMVAAYLIGMPIAKNRFKTIQVCETADQTGCFVAWRTFKKGVEIPHDNTHLAVINPLSWKTTDEYVGKENNLGSVLRKFDDIYPQLVDAQIHNGILWATKPKFPGSIFFTRKNYHIADINFYYFNIRENAKHRIGAFWK
jgi:hypothetical protein